MSDFLLVLAGGAIGSGLRFLASYMFGAQPLTTFAVNVSGAFALGLLMGSRHGSEVYLRLFLGIGVLGGYTTFSTMALEALRLHHNAGWQQAAFLLVASIAAGFAAVFAGFWLGGKLTPS